jgi:betaine-aldehyde dehydrogenase
MTDTRTLRNFVGGEQTDPADGRTYDLINPSTGEVFSEAPLSGQEDVDQAFAAAERAFETWRDTTPSDRQLAMFRIADAIEERAEELVRAESENTGKPFGLTMEEEIPAGVDQIRFFAGAARCLEGKSAGEYLEGLTSYVRREPVGVCAQVTPWNYPMMMAIWKFAPAIAAGNTVVIKPSDTTPVSTVMMAEIAAEFLPEGVFNVVCGDRDTGRTLVEHDTPQMVSITGSVRAGMQVAEAASHDLKRVHLELGGKAPVIIFDDADIEEAVEAISVAGYFNAGQDCTAATRVLAAPGAYDDFVAALTEAANGTKTGDPDDEDVLYGPLNNQNQLQHVSGMVDRLPDHAEVNAGGHRFGERGYFYEPTVVSGLEQDDEASQNEIFGPVITVQHFSDEDEAVRWANERPRPRNAGQQAPRLRVRLDQHAHPARGRDAPRRLQALRLRQGPLDVRPGGLHPHQARDEQHRGLRPIRAARNARAAQSSDILQRTNVPRQRGDHEHRNLRAERSRRRKQATFYRWRVARRLRWQYACRRGPFDGRAALRGRRRHARGCRGRPGRGRRDAGGVGQDGAARAG